MAGGLKDIVARRELLWLLVGRNVKIRYKHSALGFFWSLLGPLLLILIYAVFLRVIRFDIPLPFLVCGIVVWQFLALCLGDALHAILGNANLVTKSAFPRILLPLSTVLANLFNFLLSMVVVFVYLGVAGALHGAWPWLPVVVVTQAALCLGAALLISSANVFFRDTEHVLSVVMLAWFFMTPVIYPPTLVLGPGAFPAWVQTAFFLNPMTGIVTAYRMALLGDAGPGAWRLALSAAVAWSLLAAGLYVFGKTEKYFGDEL
jgi:ABC-type polysaccharide/polyol phosphate export permease